jgi:mxaJ protein
MERIVWLLAGRTAVLLSVVAAITIPTFALADEQDKTLRVCQDPNNLPFSNQELMGFENRIAMLLAHELGWKLEYTWYPQRMGFVRNTLRAKIPGSDNYKCDLITGVPSGFEMGITTRPYYRSTYALAYIKGRGMDAIETPQDLLALDPIQRKSLRFGVFTRSPAVDWLLQNGMIDQIVSYQHQTGDPDQYPGQIIERDLAQGKIDVAFVWGPIAAYFARNTKDTDISVVPFHPHPSIRFDFSIAMATRHGEKAFRDRIDDLLAKNQHKIYGILNEYGVPIIDSKGSLIAAVKVK